MRGVGGLFFIIYLLLGLYFLNLGLQFIAIPAFLSGIEKGIYVVGGVLLIFGSIKFLMSSRANSR
jgi:hypothetical protein